MAPALLAAGVPFVWLGDPRHLPAGTDWTETDNLSQPPETGRLAVLRHDFAAPARPGQPDPDNAHGVVEVIERAVKLVRDGMASGICTMPIHKKALQDGAKFTFPGHTEFLAHLAGGADVAMMLTSTSIDPPCRVVPATVHIALADVPNCLTPTVLEHAIRITHAAMIRDFGISTPRLAIAGINPHAGEGGAMGTEELDWIIPLLAQFRTEGLDLTGPLPADTMFHPPARRHWDAAICAYHDQALIPIKTLDFAGGVNITLGLPFVRTSPDHGTAFDIAGLNRADPASAIAALRMAWHMAQRRGAI